MDGGGGTVTGYKLSYSSGRIRAAQADYLYTPMEIRGADKYGVMALHGATAPDNFAIASRWKSSKIVGHIAHAGIPVVAGYMSGDSFANDLSMTDMTNALTLLDNSGCSVDKVHLFGISMGGTLAIRWAAQNPSKVASIQGVIPATSIDRIYQQNPAGLRTAVGNAWGVTYPTPLPAGADLTDDYATILAAGIPVRLHYTSSDALIDPTGTIADGALLGAEVVNLGGAFGHAERTVGLFDSLGDGDSSEYIAFLQQHGA